MSCFGSALGEGSVPGICCVCGTFLAPATCVTLRYSSPAPPLQLGTRWPGEWEPFVGALPAQEASGGKGSASCGGSQVSQGGWRVCRKLDTVQVHSVNEVT